MTAIGVGGYLYQTNAKMICTDSFNNQGARDFHRERNTASMTNMPVWRCALNSNKMQVTQVCCLLFFLKYILLIMLLQFSQLYPFIPCPPCTLILSAFPPPQFISMGCTYKFFEFSVSYTIFDLSLSILGLPVMLLLPGIFSLLFLPFPSPQKTLHVISISLILFLFQVFAQFLFSLFFLFLGSFLDIHEFVVILLFIVFDLLQFLR